ncbi:MAG: hypothetical protein DMG97_29010 [Acidobacteria bacterium]|nr:MAG: hypothetical protein DMG97_29010 [Acidobacteriota bacterium]
MRNIIKAILRGILPERLLTSLRCLVYPRRFAYLPGLTYCADGMACVHSTAALEEPKFVEGYELVKASGAWAGCDLQWRAYVICWAADKAARLTGDFVECGVNQGGYSRLAMHYIDFQSMPDRKFYLLDTYCGTPVTSYSRGENPATRHAFTECFEHSKNVFRSFPNAILIRGEVPGTLPQVASEKICYLSLDMNAVKPELAAAEYFWGKLVAGAPIILDDYNWIGYEEQKRGFDNFAAERGVRVLTLPTGQGLIFKP